MRPLLVRTCRSSSQGHCSVLSARKYIKRGTLLGRQFSTNTQSDSGNTEGASTCHCRPGSASRGTARQLPPSAPAPLPLLLRPRLLGCGCQACRGWLPPSCFTAGACSPLLRGVMEPSDAEVAWSSRSEELRPRCRAGGLVTSCSTRSFLPNCTAGRQAGGYKGGGWHDKQQCGEKAGVANGGVVPVGGDGSAPASKRAEQKRVRQHPANHRQ